MKVDVIVTLDDHPSPITALVRLAAEEGGADEVAIVIAGDGDVGFEGSGGGHFIFPLLVDDSPCWYPPFRTIVPCRQQMK